MTKSQLARAAEHHEVMAAIHPAPKPVKERKAKPQPDYWFSLCVRERSDWTCECCGKRYEPTYSLDTGLPGTRALHCSHYIGRANYSVRFDPIDADSHCNYCHSRFEGNPHLFLGWKVEKLGNERYDILIEKSNNIMIGKQARKEKQEIAEHYKKEYFRMRELRAQGVTGRIEFVGWV